MKKELNMLALDILGENIWGAIPNRKVRSESA